MRSHSVKIALLTCSLAMVVTGCTDYNYNRGGNAFMEKDEDITRELENDGTPATPSREIRD